MTRHRKGLYCSDCTCPGCEVQRSAILLGSDMSRALPPLSPLVESTPVLHGDSLKSECDGCAKGIAHQCLIPIDPTPKAILSALVNSYRQMPNGGAALHIHADGSIDNGMAVIAHFSSKRNATLCLQSLGFSLKHYGWKISSPLVESTPVLHTAKGVSACPTCDRGLAECPQTKAYASALSVLAVDPFVNATPCWHLNSFIQFNIQYFGTR